MFAGMGTSNSISKPVANNISSKPKPSLAPDMFADLEISGGTSNQKQSTENYTSKSKPKVTKNNDFDDFY